MTQRGRKPKPTSKKKLEGNPGKRTLNKHEPKPKMSADITTEMASAAAAAAMAGADQAAITQLAKGFAASYAPLLRETKVLTDADVAAFDLLTEHYAIARRAAAIVKRDGLMQMDKFGQVHKHPALQVMRDNSALAKAYLAEFGMTPSSRTRIEVPPDPGEDDLESQFFGAALKKSTHA